eukprot:TRINITY_DN8196_c0_g1_i1.p1 TRINITY_DN8196_c0_g1~~TRINITY_DN8196_c0_g1_i1.p1  ORF type:complete len:274 (+),score=42.09 TRINITY_DN8196_c0_g1_i1:191-1012(+)
MQPSVASGIELAGFHIRGAKVNKTLQRLEKWVACGVWWRGFVVGIDEDEDGVFFARIDPSTGRAAVLRRLPANRTMSTCGELDPETDLLHGVVGDLTSTDGALFDLYSFNVSTGEYSSVRLTPTPDPQGPGPLRAAGGGVLLAFFPGVDAVRLGSSPSPSPSPPEGTDGDDGWRLMALDTTTGNLSHTHTADMPVMRVLDDVPSWILRGSSGSILVAGLAANLGTATRMFSFDVDCALGRRSLRESNGESCVLRQQDWPGGLIDLVVVPEPKP